MTKFDAFDKSPVHSEEWFRHAMHLTSAPEWMKQAAEHICKSFGIKGQADPAFIANVIDQYFEDSRLSEEER
jgi:hypothetical protein